MTGKEVFQTLAMQQDNVNAKRTLSVNSVISAKLDTSIWTRPIQKDVKRASVTVTGPRVQVHEASNRKSFCHHSTPTPTVGNCKISMVSDTNIGGSREGCNIYEGEFKLTIL